ncbi:TRAP transporter substrate-binding protein DctP [Citricoccus nitrophenolicus]
MKRMQRIAGVAGAVGIALGLAACGGSQAGGSGEGEGSQTARLSSFLQENTSMGQAVNAWADQTEECSDGQLEFERFHGGSLFGATDTRDAVGNGRLEVGVFSPGYHTGEFPLTQGLFDIPFLSSNVPAVMDALGTMYGETPEAQTEWTDQGMYMLSMIPVAPVPMATNVPFDSLDDLQGLNLRGYPAGGLNAAITAAGANPLDMELSEVPEGMQRGVIDGFTGIAVDIAASLSLQESTKYFTEPGFGSTSAISLAVNQQWWDGLPEQVQACGEEAAANLGEPYVEAIAEVEGEACAALEEYDAELSILPEAETEKWSGMIQQDQRDLWAESSAGAIDDPQAYLADYESVLEAAEQEHSGQVFGIEGCLQ